MVQASTLIGGHRMQKDWMPNDEKLTFQNHRDPSALHLPSPPNWDIFLLQPEVHLVRKLPTAQFYYSYDIGTSPHLDVNISRHLPIVVWSRLLAQLALQS